MPRCYVPWVNSCPRCYGEDRAAQFFFVGGGACPVGLRKRYACSSVVHLRRDTVCVGPSVASRRGFDPKLPSLCVSSRCIIPARLFVSVCEFAGALSGIVQPIPVKIVPVTAVHRGRVAPGCWRLSLAHPSLPASFARASTLFSHGRTTFPSSQKKVGELIVGIMERRLDGGYDVFAPEVTPPLGRVLPPFF